MVKPVAPEEHAARVNALLRKVDFSGPFIESTAVIRYFEMSINPERILCCKSSEKSVNQRIIVSLDLEPRIFGDIRTVDTRVKNVREKLRKAGFTHKPLTFHKRSGKKGDYYKTVLYPLWNQPDFKQVSVK